LPTRDTWLLEGKMTVVRSPAVAGAFYPSDARELRAVIASHAEAAEARGTAPKAMIVPHAGYVYSGPIAASAYAQLHCVRRAVTRVVLAGPSHRIAFDGLAVSGADSFATPLGAVAIDKEATAKLLTLPQVCVSDTAHAAEHSLEVQLPFLQETLEDFQIVPLLVGDAAPEEVAEPLEAVWGGPETIVLISSDLSHYHDYETAKRFDQRTAEAIEGLRAEEVGLAEACGCRAIGGLLVVARKRGLKATRIDLRNSGDTSGSRGEVVGYGAFGFA
jgi:AmmeMemoRadiSam system protein B